MYSRPIVSPKLPGIDPLKRFSCKLRCRRDVNRPSVSGIEPVNELDCMSRYRSDVSKAMLEGMTLLIRLKPTSSFVKLPKFPIDTGNVPVSVIDGNNILVTLP
jgi:hypothetical protein